MYCLTPKSIVLRVKLWITDFFGHKLQITLINVTTFISVIQMVLRLKQLVLRVKALLLRVKHLTLRVKQLVLRVKQCIKI